MNTIKYLVVGMMALGLSTAGCAQEEDTVEDMDSVGLVAAENPTGGNTNNGTFPAVYRLNKYKLLSAMGYGLGPYTCTLISGCFYTLPSSIYQTGILNTEGGQELFNKAIECAVAENVVVKQSQASGTTLAKTYKGKGLMSTTAGWVSGALTTEQKEDVLRCVVARVNASGTEVSIKITGKNVANQPDPTNESDWLPDALFDVKITTMPSPYGSITLINEYAWPLASLQPGTSSQCFSVLDAMEARVCDQAGSNCGFQIRVTPQADCVKYGVRNGPDYYQCSTTTPASSVKRPVVQSWVRPNDLLAIYNVDPSCFPQGVDVAFDPAGLGPYIPTSP